MSHQGDKTARNVPGSKTWTSWLKSISFGAGRRFLLISLRQRILAVPDRLARQLVNIADVKQVGRFSEAQ